MKIANVEQMITESKLMGGKKSKLVGSEIEDAANHEPSPAERSVTRAHDAKVSATDSWVRGEISHAKHREIHKRADLVIKNKGEM